MGLLQVITRRRRCSDLVSLKKANISSEPYLPAPIRPDLLKIACVKSWIERWRSSNSGSVNMTLCAALWSAWFEGKKRNFWCWGKHLACHSHPQGGNNFDGWRLIDDVAGSLWGCSLLLLLSDILLDCEGSSGAVLTTQQRQRPCRGRLYDISFSFIL